MQLENLYVKMGWNFDNSYVSLPADFYTKTTPHHALNPKCIIINEELANDLDLDFAKFQPTQLAQILVGNTLVEGMNPIAQAYAGHQFGYLNILGDGRAILLGEHLTRAQQRYDIQLKGAGRTPYSRRGDGRATLSSVLREYIMSEAMHSLGIPTTRSLAVITTGEDIKREVMHKGAILMRIATSHVRIGSFEYAAMLQDIPKLKIYTDYVIKRHYREVEQMSNPYLALLSAMVEKQAALVSKWMSIGFIHGVMNTDNITLSGETLDYGPCAFMDYYDVNTVFSAIDTQGRYAYSQQPHILQWNLARFAETLLPLIDTDLDYAISMATASINEFGSIFDKYWLKEMAYKLGLVDYTPKDRDLINALLNWMQKAKADYTNTFRDLTAFHNLGNFIYQDEEFKSWYDLWHKRLSQTQKPMAEIQAFMQKHNPYIIPRNYLVEEALTAAANEDLAPLLRLLAALKDPFTANKAFCDLAITPQANPDYKTFCNT